MKLRPPLSPLAGTMTYDLESTLPMITVHPHWDAPAYFEAEEVPFERKRDAAVMFTSNCKNAGAEKRLAYIQVGFRNFTSQNGNFTDTFSIFQSLNSEIPNHYL